MGLLFTLFAAGVLTILLPCILPLVPIVLGVSLAGRSRARPLATVGGMVVSFVLCTFVLQVLLSRLVQLAVVIHLATTYALLLFGVAFLIERRSVQIALAMLGALPFFFRQGWPALVIAVVAGGMAMAIAGRVSVRLQQVGVEAQREARVRFGAESLLSAFIVGLTLGLVWVPCAGPALGFALALVREAPGARALVALSAYALGAAVPLLLIGYGGQFMVRSTRRLVRYTGRIKQASGTVLVLSALALQFQLFAQAQAWLVGRTGFGELAGKVEQRLVGAPAMAASSVSAAATPTTGLPVLPRIRPAPEFVGLGPWYNSSPTPLGALRGKVVLVDFWTYSCINCIRTLPQLRELWSRYHEQPFVIVGVHAPEFAFEKSPANVEQAVRRYRLDYPVAQDNDLSTWAVFENRYWPAKYLIDAQGFIRYTHFGEGETGATEQAIRSLLTELGRDNVRPPAAESAALDEKPISPETYLGARGWSAFTNRAGGPDARRHRYGDPGTPEVDHFALLGEWQLLDEERQILRSKTGEVRYSARAGEVNLVLGIAPGTPSVDVEVRVDGNPVNRFVVDHHDLYNLFRGSYGVHDISVRIRGPNLEAYAFTFGA